MQPEISVVRKWHVRLQQLLLTDNNNQQHLPVRVDQKAPSRAGKRNEVHPVNLAVREQTVGKYSLSSLLQQPHHPQALAGNYLIGNLRLQKMQRTNQTFSW